MKQAISASIVVLLLVSVSACKSTPEVVADTEPPVVETPVEVVEKPVEEPAKPDPPPAEEPEKEPEEEPGKGPEEAPVQETADPAEEEFKVSEEVFTETFEDIRKLIDELNAIIREENYDRWLRYLTQEYIAHFSSAEVLKKNSDQPLLKKYGINLKSLRDYFRYVVAPSRANARLDDLVFIDNEHVKAIMIIKDRRTILYQLNKIDGVWKIGL